MRGLLSSLSRFGYVIMGLVQFMAVWSLLSEHWGWHWLPAGLFGLILSYIPLVGSICGMAGAIAAWNWPWFLALLVFLWWPVLFITLAVLGLGTSFWMLRQMQRRYAPPEKTTLDSHSRTIYMDEDGRDDT